MDDLKDSLDQNKWLKLDPSKKKGFREFQIMRQHKKCTDTSFSYLIHAEEDEDPIGVKVEFTVKGKDPLKDVGTAQLLVKDKKVVGIDIEGDCYAMK